MIHLRNGLRYPSFRCGSRSGALNRLVHACPHVFRQRRIVVEIRQHHVGRNITNRQEPEPASLGVGHIHRQPLPGGIQETDHRLALAERRRGHHDGRCRSLGLRVRRGRQSGQGREHQPGAPQREADTGYPKREVPSPPFTTNDPRLLRRGDLALGAQARRAKHTAANPIVDTAQINATEFFRSRDCKRRPSRRRRGAKKCAGGLARRPGKRPRRPSTEVFARQP